MTGMDTSVMAAILEAMGFCKEEIEEMTGKEKDDVS